jgi:hypothetical protein
MFGIFFFINLFILTLGCSLMTFSILDPLPKSDQNLRFVIAAGLLAAWFFVIGLIYSIHDLLHGIFSLV